MTEPLYRHNGGAPLPLPVLLADDQGFTFTPPYADEVLSDFGFRPAPPRPADTEAQTAEWDADAEAWIMVDRPPPPPAPPPTPIILTVAQVVSRFLVPEEEALFAELDDAMGAESRLVRRNWLNDRYSFTEGDAFWSIVSGHLDALGVMGTRKAELMGREADAASTSAPPTA